MSEFLTQSALAERLVEKCGISLETAKNFSSLFFNIVRKGLKTQTSFPIHNFGTFKKTWIETTIGLNPQTGDKITIPAHWRIKFVPCKRVAERINKKYASLKATVIKEGSPKEESPKEDLPRETLNDKYIPIIENKSESLYRKAEEHELKDMDEFFSNLPDPKIYAIPEDEERLKFSESTTLELHNVKELLDKDTFEEGSYDDEEIETAGKELDRLSAKLIALSGVGSIFFILLISLLIKSGHKNQNKTEPFKNFDLGSTTEDITSSIQDEEIDASSIDAVDTEDTTVSELEESYTPDESYEYDEISAEELFESYLVPMGSSYYKIALEKYGNAHLWPFIYMANKDRNIDPDFVPAYYKVLIPQLSIDTYSKDKLSDAVLTAYNAYLLMREKQPDSPRNEERRIFAIRVLVSGELLNRGFIEQNRARILPDYAETALNIVNHQYN